MNQKKQQHYLATLTTLLRTASATRGCAPLAVLLVLYSLHIIWALITLYLFDQAHVFNLAVFQQQLPIMFGIMLGAALLLRYGWQLYHRGRDPEWFQHLAANYYGLALVWTGHLIGAMSMAAGVVLMGAPLIGFLVLRRRVVVIAFIVAFFALMLSNIAAAFGWLPYAPLILHPLDRSDALLWTHSQLLMAAPHLLVDIILAYLTLSRWRRRERKAIALSLTDSLTGIANRRNILAQFSQQLALAQRQHQPLAVAMVDIDHFKQINDSYGHAVGDLVLQQVSAALASEIRGADAVGRIGGEEFLLLMPATDIDDGKSLLDRCRQRVQQLAIKIDNETLSVSASFGLAWTDGQQYCDTDALMLIADQALYQAKHDGRNCLRCQTKPCTSQQRQSKATPPPAWHWRHTLMPRFWVGLLNNIMEWSAAQKVALCMAIAAFMALNFGGLLAVLGYYAESQGAAAFINASFAKTLSMASWGILLAALCLMSFALYAHSHHWRNTYWLQFICLQFFGQTLVAFGFTLGIFYLPTGIMLICMPIIGFILFERIIVLQVFLTSVALIMVLAYAAALGWLPYAPVIVDSANSLQTTHPVWLFLNYYFVSLAIPVVLALAQHILGRWRERDQQVRELGQIDLLTQLPNRHHILDQLNRVMEQAQRQQRPLALVLLDLDHFKPINDTFGHPTGDAALVAAAKALRGALRDSDLVGRYGGEEFLLILPDADQAAALRLSERCRQALTEIDLRSDDNQRIPLSASFGIVCVEHGIADMPAANDTDVLLKCADDALYRAKDKGRNRLEAILSPTRSLSA